MNNFVFDILNFYNRTKPSDNDLIEFILSLNYRVKIKKPKGGESTLNKTKIIMRKLSKEKQVGELRTMIRNIVMFFDYDFDMDEQVKKTERVSSDLECVINSCVESLEWGLIPKKEEELELVKRSLKEKQLIQEYMINM